MPRSRTYRPSTRTVLVRINPEQYDAIVALGGTASSIIETWHKAYLGVERRGVTDDPRHFKRLLAKVHGSTGRAMSPY